MLSFPNPLSFIYSYLLSFKDFETYSPFGVYPVSHSLYITFSCLWELMLFAYIAFVTSSTPLCKSLTGQKLQRLFLPAIYTYWGAKALSFCHCGGPKERGPKESGFCPLWWYRGKDLQAYAEAALGEDGIPYWKAEWLLLESDFKGCLNSVVFRYYS